jgi:hypothetical protein
MQKPYKCAWGQQFSVGDTIVASRYYQKWGQSKHSYGFLKKSQVVVWDICNVRAIKFPMVPTSHRVQGNDPMYKLLHHVEDGIKEVITTLD